jgi:hypothetical protein
MTYYTNPDYFSERGIDEKDMPLRSGMHLSL